jgi:branched-chain amino acid transport system permease protein
MTGISPWVRETVGLWLAVVIGVGSTAAIYFLLRSKYGLSLVAIRDSERASKSIGIRVDRLKRLIYVLSAFGCGVCGALIYVTKLRISPDAAFSIDWTIGMIFVVVIGGVGTLEGPIIGTVAYFILRELLSQYGTIYMIVLGLLAVVTMLRFPKGIWGHLAERFDLHLFPVQRRVGPAA